MKLQSTELERAPKSNRNFQFDFSFNLRGDGFTGGAGDGFTCGRKGRKKERGQGCVAGAAVVAATAAQGWRRLKKNRER